MLTTHLSLRLILLVLKKKACSCDRFLLTERMVKILNHAHIRYQRVKIYKNQCFVFNSTLFEFVTAFSTAILTVENSNEIENLENGMTCYRPILLIFNSKEKYG